MLHAQCVARRFAGLPILALEFRKWISIVVSAFLLCKIEDSDTEPLDMTKPARGQRRFGGNRFKKFLRRL